MKGWKKVLGVAISCVFALSCFACSSEPDGSNPSTENNNLTYSGGNWSQRIDADRSQTITLSKSTVRDKILGCWVGQAIGLGSGYEYVLTTNAKYAGTVVTGYKSLVAIPDEYWEPNGQICSGSIGVNVKQIGPISDPRVKQNKVISDDDMHVDILNQFIFRDYGPDLGAWEASAGWDKYGVSDVGGGEAVTETVSSLGYFSPYTGTRMFGNMGWWVTESWIENETIGLIFPYMANTAEAYAEIFTGVQGDGYCTYLGKLSALMQSMVYEYSDMKVLLEKAFERMDRGNPIYQVYEYILGEYNKGTPWRDVNIYVANNFTEQGIISTHVGQDRPAFSLTANAGNIFLGLIYGDNDFEKSIKITSLAGLDGDCTACTVGGLLGTAIGFDNLPQKYKNFMNGNSIYANYTGDNGVSVGENWGGKPFAYCAKNFPNILTFNQITDITLKNLEAQIVARGGSVSGDVYTIAKQSHSVVPKVELVNPSFEAGNYDGWTFDNCGNASATFSVSALAPGFGLQGGIMNVELGQTAKLYQPISVTAGNRYRVSMWISGCEDREVRIIAGDKYRSYKNPASNDYVKYDMTFTAEETGTVNVGIQMMGGNADTFSDVLYLDDLFVEDITHLTESYYQQFTVYDFMGSPGIRKVTKGENKGKLKLSSGDAIRFDFEGIEGYQLVKVYYSNPNFDIGLANLKVDSRSIGTLPLIATGDEANFNEGNAQTFMVYAGAGTHTLKITVNSFDDVIIDRVEVYGGNASFNKN